MIVTMDKKYQTVGGVQVRIYALDGEGEFPVHGAILADGKWCLQKWRICGSFSAMGNGLDLVEVWEPKDKEPVWAWYTNYKAYRILGFWGDKDRRLFNPFTGKRNGFRYDKYAKVEHIEQWMIDTQQKLED